MPIPDRIKLTREFTSPTGDKMWPTIEGVLLPGEDDVEALKQVHANLERYAREIGGVIEVKNDYGIDRNGYPTNNKPDPRESRVQMFINEINACTALFEINSKGVQVGLIAYEKVGTHDLEIRAAYDKKLKSLQ